MRVTRKIKQEVWWAMYNMAIKEKDYLRGMIITITDEWDNEQWIATYNKMVKGEVNAKQTNL